MSATATAQRPSTASEERPALSAMAFVSDTVTLSRVSADLFNMTLGKANVREGRVDSAVAIGEWPRDLDLLIVDVGEGTIDSALAISEWPRDLDLLIVD